MPPNPRSKDTINDPVSAAIRRYKQLWLRTHPGLLGKIGNRCGVSGSCVANVFWGRYRSPEIQRGGARSAEIEHALAEYALAAPLLGDSIDDPVSGTIRCYKKLWLRNHRSLLEDFTRRFGVTGDLVRSVFWGRRRSAKIEHAFAAIGIIVGPPVRRRNVKAA